MNLLDTTDAMTWASEFVRIFNGRMITDVIHPNDDVDEGTMLTWFAGAIETGRSQGRRELCPHRDMITIDNDLEICADCGKPAELRYDDD